MPGREPGVGIRPNAINTRDIAAGAQLRGMTMQHPDPGPMRALAVPRCRRRPPPKKRDIAG